MSGDGADVGHGHQPERGTLIWRLAQVRRELDQLASSRVLAPLDDGQRERYGALCDEEQHLLHALGPDVPCGRPHTESSAVEG
jgi:hypothetical protein